VGNVVGAGGEAGLLKHAADALETSTMPMTSGSATAVVETAVTASVATVGVEAFPDR
jgi:hypothetical protein